MRPPKERRIKVASKRGAGEFAVYKRGNSYVARYRLPIGADGKRRRKSFTAPTRKEAIQLANEFRRKVELGLHVGKASISFSEFFGEWFEAESKRKNYKPNTIETYTSISKPILNVIGNIPMDSINSYHVDQAVFAVVEGYTVRAERRWNLLSMVLKAAHKRKIIAENPMDFMDAPASKVAEERRALTVEEVAKLISAAEELGELETEIKTLVATGMRVGELRALTWDDLDTEIPALRVNKTTYEVQGRIAVGETKTKNANRLVEISEALVKQLQKHHIAQQTTAVLEPVVYVHSLGRMDRQEHNLIFPDAAGKLMRHAYLHRHFKKVVEASGIANPETVKPHVLRHTHATLALAAGLDLFFLSRRLGHGTIATTADVYSHLTLHSQEKGATVIDEILEQSNG